MKTKKIIKLINKKDKIVSIKSETVFGLYALPTIQNIKNLNKLKKRELKQPIQISADSIKSVMKYIDVTEKQLSILAESLPGKRSFLIKGSRKAEKLGLDSIMIRVPNKHEAPLLVSVLEKTGPLLSTSANFKGEEPINNPRIISSKFKIKTFNDKLIKTLNGSSEIIDLRGKGVRIIKR